MSNIKRELEAWGWDPARFQQLRQELTDDLQLSEAATGQQLVADHVKVAQLGGIKHDSSKLRMDLIPPECLEEVAKVLTFGANKYSDWNWAKGFKWSRLYASTLRHLYAHMRGESKDKETNISHLAHATCNLLFLMYHELHGVGEDDRHPRPSDR